MVAIAPDPYGYIKQSAVCTLSPVKTDAAGRSVQMSVRSDDGRCAVAVSQPDGTAYASFLLQALPAHGKAFIHNYNNQTLVDYTATTAYAGPDSFTVSLIPTANGQRALLHVDTMVDATGVVVPPPPLISGPPARSSTGSGAHKTATRHHTTTATKKKTTNSN